MSPIDRGINLVCSILDSASVTYLGVSTIESFNRVLHQLKVAKYKIASKVDIKKIKSYEDEQEM